MSPEERLAELVSAGLARGVGTPSDTGRVRGFAVSKGVHAYCPTAPVPSTPQPATPTTPGVGQGAAIAATMQSQAATPTDSRYGCGTCADGSDPRYRASIPRIASTPRCCGASRHATSSGHAARTRPVHRSRAGPSWPTQLSLAGQPGTRAAIRRKSVQFAELRRSAFSRPVVSLLSLRPSRNRSI